MIPWIHENPDANFRSRHVRFCHSWRCHILGGYPLTQALYRPYMVQYLHFRILKFPLEFWVDDIHKSQRNFPVNRKLFSILTHHLSHLSSEKPVPSHSTWLMAIPMEHHSEWSSVIHQFLVDQQWDVFHGWSIICHSFPQHLWEWNLINPLKFLKLMIWPCSALLKSRASQWWPTLSQTKSDPSVQQSCRHAA